MLLPVNEQFLEAECVDHTEAFSIVDQKGYGCKSGHLFDASALVGTPLSSSATYNTTFFILFSIRYLLKTLRFFPGIVNCNQTECSLVVAFARLPQIKPFIC